MKVNHVWLAKNLNWTYESISDNDYEHICFYPFRIRVRGLSILELVGGHEGQLGNLRRI